MIFEEVRLQLKNPIESSFDVQLSKFMKRCAFLASNNGTVSPVEMTYAHEKQIFTSPLYMGKLLQ